MLSGWRFPNLITLETFGQRVLSEYLSQAMYTDGYDHAGWQLLTPPLAKAFKAGTTDLMTLTPATGSVSGAFWHRPWLVSASCSGDSPGKPSGSPAERRKCHQRSAFHGLAGNAVTVYSGNNQIALHKATCAIPDINADWSSDQSENNERVQLFLCLITFSASTIDVVADTSGICSFNYQAVKLSA
ncbi:hypothetical protein BDZ89DRAFT_1173099 [Hymenopellis radicata]|nr:hypothetical protein BDZ89DRAFT_1173099 [Hymenopellis radicata]